MANPLNIPFHDYQEQVKDFMLSRPRCGLFLDMGLGKAVDDNTIIPTPVGNRRLGDLTVGDTVFDMYGCVTHITAVYKHKQKTAYRVTLEDGRSFVCCDEHLIPVLTPNGNVEPQMLRDIIPWPAQGRRYAIPWNHSVDYRADAIPLNPTLMGWILAHGRLENGEIKFDEDSPIAPPAMHSLIADCMRSLGFKSGEPFDHIPIEYIQRHVMDRRDLLFGLAGYSDVDPPRTPMLKFQVPGDMLVHDIKQLVWSMGFAIETKYRPRKKITEITIPMSMEKHRQNGLAITDIERVSDRDMTCFTVSSHTHTYLINDYIVTHNTLITLAGLYERNPTGHVLIVAPKTIARSTWLDEIKKWKIPIRTKSLITNENGKDLSRKKRLERYAEVQTDPPTVYFINRELLPDLIKHMPVVNKRPVWYFPHVVLDEAQSFKSHKSDRTKALMRVLPCIETLVELSGTPAPNGLMDLWAEVYLLDGGARLGKTITAYRNRFFRETLYINGYPVRWEPLPGAEEEIYNLISDIVISVKNPNIKLPAVTYKDTYVYMDADELALYKTFVKEHVVDLSNDVVVKANNNAVLRGKLSQMASGALYIDNDKNFEVIHTRKLDMCEYIINNSSGNILIAYYFNSDLKMLKEHFPDAVIFDGSPEMQADWNAGKIHVLLLHPASAGFGVNIQYGGHTLIWYTIPTNLEHYLQTNARLVRQGQPDPVVIHHLLCDKTVDAGNLARLYDKDTSEKRLLEAVEMAISYVMD